MRSLHFVLPGDPETRSGGFLYDRRVIAALREAGWPVTEHALPDGFPFPSEAARAAAADLLATPPEGAAVVIDGLALGVLPAVVAAHSGRLRLIALVHHPLAEETGLDATSRARLFDGERGALAQVAGVVTTSRHTALGLRDYGVPAERIRVAEPGVEPAPLAKGSGEAAPVLLCVASLTPRKGHAVLIEALAMLRDHAWHLRCAGSEARDPACAESLRALVAAQDLGERIAWLGEADEAALSRLYDGADLFVLASHHEGYGMVLTEALMRGLPVVATSAGAIPEALPDAAARLVPPNDPPALAEALRPLIADATARADLAAAARRAREALPSWRHTGARFAAALEALLP